MQIDPEQLRRLADEYKSGTINAADKAVFEAWLLEQTSGDIIWEGAEKKQDLRNEMLFNINQAIKPAPVRKIWLRYVAAAASVLIIISVGAYFFNRPDVIKPATVQLNDALPGREGAILTLADGRQMVLDSLHPGEINIDNNVAVLNEGKLTYNSANGNAGVYNTLSTPKGRIYKLILSDGTAVWLNSFSSITYPLVFDKNARKVSITGEVYFEVAENSKQPFMVSSPIGKNDDAEGGQEIIVLGTSFNINAYPDEKITSTTLLDGKIKLNYNSHGIIMFPGQQAKISDKVTVKNNIDTEEVMAWKNGSFIFNDADIAQVLRQLSRWYDVNIKYEGKIPDKKLTGEVLRDSKLSEVLKALEYTGVKFSISDKTIIVTE
jgi:transmembrane sensor